MASEKGSVLHSKIAMKGLGSGKRRLQHNIVDCSLTFELFRTDEAFTVNGCKHTHSHIRKQQVGKSGWEGPGSRPEYFCKKGVIKIFTNFTEKHLCRSFFLIELQADNTIKKETPTYMFPINFAKSLETPIFTEHLLRMLLGVLYHRTLSLYQLSGR